MDEWGLEALELKAWMVILGTKIGENSNTHKLIGELGGFFVIGPGPVLPWLLRLSSCPSLQAGGIHDVLMVCMP